MIHSVFARHGRWLMLALAVLGAEAIAWSQANSAPTDLTEISLEELAQVKVYSASRHLEESRKAPSAVSVITAEEIRHYGWRTLADVLRSLRGFYVGHDRIYSYIGVRGFQRPGDYNGRILLQINGHRVNEDVYDSAQVGSEFPLDLDLVDHIEVVRGLSSSLFGTNAVFGVINVITRKPSAAETVEVAGSASSFLGRKGRISAAFHNRRVSGLLSATMYRSNGAGELYFPEYDSPERKNGLARDVDGTRFSQAFVDLVIRNLRVEGLLSQRRKLIGIGAYGTVFGEAGTSGVDTRGYISFSYRRDFSERTELEMRGHFDNYGLKGWAMMPNRITGTPYLGGMLFSSDSLGFETTVGRAIGKHRLTVGGGVEHSPSIKLENFLGGGSAGLKNEISASRFGSFGEIELNPVSKLKIHLGGRVDWFDSFGATASPRVAVIYSPNEKTALKYIFGRAFRAPNSYENYYSDGIQVEPHAQPLRPERFQSHEVILERTLSKWVRFTADAYYNDLSQLSDQVPDAATGLTYFVNSGSDRGRAVELEIEGKRASGFAFRASYSLSEATDLLRRRRLENSPLHQVKLNSTLPLGGRAFLGIEAISVSAQRTYQQTRVPPFVIANFTLSTRPLWGGWEFSASCYNAFDRTWWSPVGPQVGVAAIQQDSRSFGVKLIYRWSREEGK